MSILIHCNSRDHPMPGPASRSKKIVSLAILFFLLWAGPCPLASGVARAFSVGEERQVGEKLLSIVRKKFKLLDDPDITDYINKLGREILTIAGPQYFHYHFFVINNKEFNAFAAPSGLIFIHSGLIEITDTEGELVGVMAHEVGHVTSRHIASRISKSAKLNVGTTALMLAGIALGGGPLGEALIAGSMAAGQTMNLKFSRQDEEEADRLAFTWLKAEGRNPRDMVTMLKKMRRISRYRQGSIPPYLLTHPNPEQRINYIDDLLSMERQTTYRQTDPFDFQRIKYRILTLTKKPATLLPIFQKKAADQETAAGIMADYGLSQVYLANGAYDKARATLRKVIARHPEKSILLTDLGTINFQAGHYSKALSLFKRAHEADPADNYTTFHYARALERNGNLKRALAMYERLLPALPDYSRLYYRIGQAKAAQGAAAEGHYYLGIYYWQEGDAKSARYHLEQAVQGLPAGHRVRELARARLEKIKQIEKTD